MSSFQESLFSNINKNKNRKAIYIDNKFYTYKEIYLMSLSIIEKLEKNNSKIIGIFNHKNIFCYISILATILSNKVFVPLNPKFSEEKNLHMIKTSGVDTIVTITKYKFDLNRIQKKLKKKIIILNINNRSLKKQIKMKNKIIKSKVNDTCYILFTSGSSGYPKGVPIINKNINSYIHNLNKRYKFSYNDRFSNNFEITFDLFLHDLLLAWTSGACLYIPNSEDYFNISLFIKKHKLTCWFSVPSLAENMLKGKQLKKNNFPSLKYSAFCGEALPEDILINWKNSSPNTVIDNLYGPTETTIAIMGYRWRDKKTLGESMNGIVSIGSIFSGNKIDRSSKRSIFDLLISGNQVFKGYLDNKQKNVISFKKDKEIYYKTGDLVTVDKMGKYFFLGRKDRQIKVSGYRVELQEIENQIKQLLKSSQVVVMGWPKTHMNQHSYKSLILFLANVPKIIHDKEILDYMKNKLSNYQIPKKIIHIKKFNYNSNGKIDYNNLYNKI